MTKRVSATAATDSDAPARITETVLIVDDDPAIRRLLGDFLRRVGYHVLEEGTGESGVETYRRERPEVVLLDVHIPDRSGFDVFEDLRPEGPVVVFLTGVADIETAVKAMRLGAENFLVKPVELAHLMAVIERAMDKVRLRREVRQLRGRMGKPTLDGALGVSPAMQALEREIATIAASDRTTVLITGESGTGKGRVAQLIHAYSPRAGNPFVSINCGGLTATFLDDELFGHERGAFTDAKTAKEGLLEIGNGGTVFLDEIGELPSGLQPKLLTVLDTRRFRRLGGTREVATDIRLIAATNRVIQKAVEQGAFREDLYYRIAVAVLHLPPVRERTREDRLHLIQRVLAELIEEVPGAPSELTSDALERLLTYEWPGNVREIRNVLERGMIMARTDAAIGVGHLPRDLGKVRQAAQGPASVTLEEAEREQIARSLKRHDGNRTKTAKELGISRVTLLKKIRKYGLE